MKKYYFVLFGAISFARQDIWASVIHRQVKIKLLQFGFRNYYDEQFIKINKEFEKDWDKSNNLAKFKGVNYLLLLSCKMFNCKQNMFNLIEISAKALQFYSTVNSNTLKWRIFYGC